MAAPNPPKNAAQALIAVVPGDGIGPEVCQAAVDVIKAAVGDDRLCFVPYEAGAECYRRSGVAYPEETARACREADAILHGAAGLPGVLYPDGTEAGQDFSLKIRAQLDLYANVRPIRLYAGVRPRLSGWRAGEIDYVIVRENTEGLYAARGGGNLLRDEVATDTLVVSRKGVERVVRFAAELARQRDGAPRDGKRRVTVVDKSNVLRSYAFFRRVADEVLADYPDIEVDHALADAITVHLTERPDFYDVIVTENFLGDIISDLGAATVGGMGMGAAAEIGDEHGYFQASHGSAPSIVGKGIANPVASILSGAWMLDWLGQRQSDPALIQAGSRIRHAVESALKSKPAHTPDLGGNATTEACVSAVCDGLAATEVVN